MVLIALFPLGCSHRPEKNAIKIMTLNVRFDNPVDSLNAWPNRVHLICNQIDVDNPDVIGMQEVLWHQLKQMDSVLTGYGSAGTGRDDGARAGEMVPVYFKKERFDMVRTITFWLSETPEIPGSKAWGSSLPRIVTWMELVERNSHQHFFFFNTHFAHDSDSARIMSSKMLLNEIKKITDGFPFIVTGDFNMLPSSTGYGVLTGPAESIPLIKDAYNVSLKRPEGPAYTFNGFSDKPGNGRLDYIFVRNGMKVLNHRTIVKTEHGIFISDHWPVESTILLKEK
jgi:endonuclease/exonuclease/phosphatase family metal-dependent hydrolase